MNKLRVVTTYSSSVKLILLWNLCFCLGLSMYSLLYNLYLNEIVDESTIGRVVAVTFLSYALCSLLGGISADKIGPRKSLLIGLFVLGSGIIGGAFTEQPVLLVAWGIVIGMGQAFTNVMFVPLLTEHSTNEQRVKLFSIAYSSGTFAMFFGTLCGGIIADQLKQWLHISSLFSIRQTIFLSALFILVSLFPLLMVKENRNEQPRGPKQNPIIEAMKNRNTRLQISSFGLLKLIEGIGLGLTIPFINLFLANKFGIRPSSISIIISLATLATVFFMVFNPKITNRLGDYKTLSIYQLIGLPSLICMSLFGNVIIVAIFFVLYRAMFYSMMPIQSKILMENIDDNSKGLAHSIGFMSNTIGVAIISPFYMWVTKAVGFEWGYVILYVVASMLLSGSVLTLYLVFGRNTNQSIPKKLPFEGI